MSTIIRKSVIRMSIFKGLSDLMNLSRASVSEKQKKDKNAQSQNDENEQIKPPIINE